MKVLILSCKTGGGHDAAGFAVKEALEQKGHEAVMFDYLTLAGQKVSDTVGDVYVNTVKRCPMYLVRFTRLGWLPVKLCGNLRCIMSMQNGKIFKGLFRDRKF